MLPVDQKQNRIVIVEFRYYMFRSWGVVWLFMELSRSSEAYFSWRIIFPSVWDLLIRIPLGSPKTCYKLDIVGSEVGIEADRTQPSCQ